MLQLLFVVPPGLFCLSLLCVFLGGSFSFQGVYCFLFILVVSFSDSTDVIFESLQSLDVALMNKVSPD